jgi:hypothetical protein
MGRGVGIEIVSLLSKSNKGNGVALPPLSNWCHLAPSNKVHKDAPGLVTVWMVSMTLIPVTGNLTNRALNSNPVLRS